MMKKQKVMSQARGQDKTPEKQLNEVEIGNLPEKEFRIMTVKMIQGLRKKNGGKGWEDARNVYQRPRRTKEWKTETNNTRRSQQQNNLGRSTDKRPGGQNGGNHCHRTEYRKKEWKEM